MALQGHFIRFCNVFYHLEYSVILFLIRHWWWPPALLWFFATEQRGSGEGALAPGAYQVGCQNWLGNPFLLIKHSFLGAPTLTLGDYFNPRGPGCPPLPACRCCWSWLLSSIENCCICFKICDCCTFRLWMSEPFCYFILFCFIFTEIIPPICSSVLTCC